MEVAHSPILGCETSLPLLVEWILGAPPPSQIRRILLHMNIDPFSLLYRYIFRGCSQWILMTLDSSSAKVNEEGVK
jgi:hypothetical protein